MDTLKRLARTRHEGHRKSVCAFEIIYMFLNVLKNVVRNQRLIYFSRSLVKRYSKPALFGNPLFEFRKIKEHPVEIKADYFFIHESSK